MRTSTKIALTAALAALLPASAAMAQSYDDENEPPRRLGLFKGAAVSVGAGVGGFGDDEMRDFTEMGGVWDARGVIGTRSILALEAAYVGMAQDINAIGLDDSAKLLSNGVEALFRVNITPQHDLTPYLMGGAGFTYMNIISSDVNTSNLNDDDGHFNIPIGAGFAYRTQGLVLDLRGTYRAVATNDLTRPATGENEDIQLDNWSASARLGWEF